MMSKIPNTIYLQWHGDGTPDDPGPVDRDAVTWSTSPVFEHDVRYTRGGWISVDDRLPEPDVDVLVFYQTNHGGMDSKGYDIAYMDIIKKEWDDTTYCWPEWITHWQPLPEPPAPA
jgi:hypothetical protein